MAVLSGLWGLREWNGVCYWYVGGSAGGCCGTLRGKKGEVGTRTVGRYSDGA